MNIEILDKVDLSSIRKEVMNGRFIRVLPADVWRRYDWNTVRQLMHETGTYVLPTQELIDYLISEIGDMRAIEIGAGNGVVGRTLGIRSQEGDCRYVLSNIIFRLWAFERMFTVIDTT